MKSNPHVTALAEEQASLWAAKLDGSSFSADDRTDLELWLDADPVHRTLLASYCQFSADIEQQLPLIAGLRDELAESQTTIKTIRPFPWLRWPILAGVTLTAAAMVVVFLWQGQPQNHFQNITTPVGQRQDVTLADGTQIELNAQTAVVVAMGSVDRRVRLASGEAFFRVSTDPTRPFYVETPAGTVRVTGTQFNVRSDTASSLEVMVLEGSVQVRTSDTSPAQALKTGDKLSRETDSVNVTALSDNELNAALAWRQGQIVFAGTPLREALARFARYHGRNLSAADSVAALRVGGRYSLDDLDGFLVELAGGILPVRVIRQADGSIQVAGSIDR